MTQSPPGGYPDPDDGWHSQRYWDGTSWTHFTAPNARTKATFTVPNARRQKNFNLLCIGADVGFLAFPPVLASTHSSHTSQTIDANDHEAANIRNAERGRHIGDEGRAAIDRATSNRVYPTLEDAVDVGCNKLPYGDAPIVRTDPVAARCCISSAMSGCVTFG
jgi:hypothetical protein